MKPLVFGGEGQVGFRIAEQTGCTALKRADCDITTLDASSAAALFSRHQPEIIINATGFTAVDAAEEQADRAMAVNAHAPALMARVAAKLGIPFVHFSTDYVFDGKRGAPYAEDAPTHPLNRYGFSKREGEKAILEAGGHIFRLQWIYDVRGQNFFRSMMQFMAQKDNLRVVADQRGAPSFAPDVAACIIAALPLINAGKLGGGIYHLAAGGSTSWHGFATAIRDGLRSRGAPCMTTTIEPITTEEYPSPATRPQDARLDSGLLASHGIAMKHWRSSFNDAMDRLS